MKISVTQEDIVFGTPRASCYCPVARAIKRQFPNQLVFVARSYISIGEAISVKVPKEVLDFIDAFDHGRNVVPFEFNLEIPGVVQ